MFSKYLIYALLDPWTGAPRYIGQSSQGLARPRSHANPSAHRGHSHRANWLRKIREAGKAYGTFVLEILADRSLLTEAERRWIAFGRASGWPLVNFTDGGEGAGPRPDLRRYNASRRGLPGRVQTPSEIEKRRSTLYGNTRGQALKGRQYSSATLYRMQASQRRRQGGPCTRINLLPKD